MSPQKNAIGFVIQIGLRAVRWHCFMDDVFQIVSNVSPHLATDLFLQIVAAIVVFIDSLIERFLKPCVLLVFFARFFRQQRLGIVRRFYGTIKDAVKCVIILHRNRIKFVIVAAGTHER